MSSPHAPQGPPYGQYPSGQYPQYGQQYAQYPQYGQQYAQYPPPPPPAPKKRKWPLVVGGIVFLFLFVSCVNSMGRSTGSTSASTAPTAGGTAPSVVNSGPPASSEEAQTEFAVGQTVDLDGLQLTAGPLTKAKGLSRAVLCSRVDYVNNSGAEVSYNGLFDWKLQTPDNVIENIQAFGGERKLGSGDLAPGGKVSGNVCFDDPKQKGDYYVIHDELTLGSTPETRWKTTI